MVDPAKLYIVDFQGPWTTNNYILLTRGSRQPLIVYQGALDNYIVFTRGLEKLYIVYQGALDNYILFTREP